MDSPLVSRTVRDPSDRMTRIAPRAASPSNASSSVSGIVSTLLPTLVVAAIFFGMFLFLRRLYPRIYQPRSFLSSLRNQERSPPLPKGLFAWWTKYMAVPDVHILQTQSLDTFLFIRLLKMAVITCVVGCVLTMPVLFPVNATGPAGQKQLNIIAFANATSGDQPTSYFRWFAHAGCSWLFFGFVLYMITRESLYYINLRQAYLLSPLYSNRLSSRTVLFTSVPDAYLDEALLREMLSPGVERIWIPKNVDELEEEVGERDKIALKLEGAETALVVKANQKRLKAMAGKGAHPDADGGESGDNATARWITAKERPTHKLKPLIGKKVDTIDWCRSELSKRIPEIEQHQATHRRGDTKKLHSVFVQYSDLRGAQSAFQSLTHHQPLHMSSRYTGINPEEIIWSNLDISWLSRVIRGFITVGVVTALCIFWTIPVAVIGAISNITTIKGTSGFEWLAFLDKLPSVLYGVVTGLLPVILLAVLMALLPIFLRFMAKFSGSATLSEVEYHVQNYYFAFQVLQVFLVNTLASGIIGSLGQILSNPASATTLLAQNLPTASNFYLSYFIFQGIGGFGSIFVAIVALLLFSLLGKILDKTPRKKLARWITLAAPALGTVYPIYTNLFVIAICYAVLAPLVLAFAAIGLYLFYLAYRYEFLYVYGNKFDTKGLMYPRALQQLFVGLYVAEICLIGLFAIGMGTSPSGAVGPLIMEILMLIFTALYHVSLNSALDPLLRFLPKTLETEERRLLALEDSDNEAAEATGHSTKDMADGEEANGTGVGKAPKQKTTNLKQGNMLQKFFRPDVYSDYYHLRQMVPRDFATVEYDEKTADDAFYHPSILSEPPLLWIPRDESGVSRNEIRHTPNEIQITDEGAYLNDKNQIVWDTSNATSAPIYQDKIYY